MSLSAKSHGLCRCPVCHALNRVPKQGVLACGRCGSAVSQRSDSSLGKVWALLISAMVLYVPANLLPVMTVVSLGRDSSSTLMEGVVHFVHDGAWFLALVVFVASVFVPLLKMLVLGGLLLSVQRGWCGRLAQRTRLYRLVEFVGRWSMVDVFVIALLVALVQFGELASIMVGPGTLSFAAVVILTIWATEAFDVRWMWDLCEEKNDPRC